MSDKRILFVPEVMDRFGASKTSIHDWIKAGLLPTPRWFGRRRYWLEEEIANLFVVNTDED